MTLYYQSLLQIPFYHCNQNTAAVYQVVKRPGKIKPLIMPVILLLVILVILLQASCWVWAPVSSMSSIFTVLTVRPHRSQYCCSRSS